MPPFHPFPEINCVNNLLFIPLKILNAYICAYMYVSFKTQINGISLYLFIIIIFFTLLFELFIDYYILGVLRGSEGLGPMAHAYNPRTLGELGRWIA